MEYLKFMTRCTLVKDTLLCIEKSLDLAEVLCIFHFADMGIEKCNMIHLGQFCFEDVDAF